MVASALSDTRDARILDGALRCVSRWGTSKTTLDDVAREAGCSRATIYRLFPGGKESLLAAAAQRDIGRFFESLADRLDACDDLDDLAVTAITAAARWVQGHEVFQYLLAHEPEVVLPHLAFRRLDGVFRLVTAYAAPHLERFVEPVTAARIAEWAARLVLSFTLTPSDHVDLASERDTRRIVQTYLLPGVPTTQGS